VFGSKEEPVKAMIKEEVLEEVGTTIRKVLSSLQVLDISIISGESRECI